MGKMEDEQRLVAARETDGAYDYDDEDYEPTREERRVTAREDNLEECFGICLFFIYLMIFSISMLLEQSAQSSRFADHIHAKLASVHYDLDMVVDTKSYYDYLEKAFIPALWENSTDTKLATDMSTYLHPLDVQNRIVGSVQFRQVRVATKNDCQVSPMFKQYMVPCFPPFSTGGMWGGASTESKTSFGPQAKFTWSDDPTGSAFSGTVGSYPAGGFMQYLSTNITKAKMDVTRLKEEAFLGSATRACFLDFAVWASNTGTYAAVTVAVEFGPTGSSAHKTTVLIISESSLQPAGTGAPKDVVAFVLVNVVILFVIYYMYEEGKEFRESRLAYFQDGWNILDWINMILILIAFVTRLLVFAAASGMAIGEAALKDKDAFTNLRGLAVSAEMVRLLMAMNAVLLWLKVSKYLKKIPKVKELVVTIWSALTIFLPFLFMFGLLFIGFVISYNVGFGDKIRELSTFSSTVVYLMRAYLKDVKLRPAYEITPLFGAGMILLFYVTCVLVSVTVVNAIFNDAIFRGKHNKPKKKFSLAAKHEIEIHEDQPVEECGREMVEVYWRAIDGLKNHAPRSVLRLLPRRDFGKKERDLDFAADEDEDGEGDLDEDGRGASKALGDRDIDDYDSDYDEETMDNQPAPTSRKDVLRAVEHMSGRVLSEVSIVGIEIRSELHDVCERVAQMQMAVEELTWRTDRVRSEQEDYLH